MQVFRFKNTNKNSTHNDSREEKIRKRILKQAQSLFASKGFDGATTKDIAAAAQIAEGTLFRYFPNKKAILIEVVTEGWVEILTDLLTELSEMDNYKAVAKVMRKRMLRLKDSGELFRVCFLEAQFHPDLRDRIQTEIISKMTTVAEAFFQTAMDKGIYRRSNPRIVAQVFLGMFAIAGFSNHTIIEPDASPEVLQEMAEGIADIFLHGVLADK
ncbi:MAG: TetR/AcrR family transcriptional regulator [Gloeocapsa sp. DLM2.Bin57]|nr:MAG: TetR/AcrR family transcriptional regulator [Gloeocapsa sp. DLM2.Bin57]